MSVKATDGTVLLQKEECIVVHVADIHCLLKNFKFKVNKTSFPKVQDKGEATASLTLVHKQSAVLSLSLSLSLLCL